MLVVCWFSTVSSVKALISKCSQGQQSIHTGGERLWKVESVSLHTEKPPENQQINDKNATAEVNTLKSKPSHSNPLKIMHKKPPCEGVNAFLRIKIRIEACERLGKQLFFSNSIFIFLGECVVIQKESRSQPRSHWSCHEAFCLRCTQMLNCFPLLPSS